MPVGLFVDGRGFDSPTAVDDFTGLASLRPLVDPIINIRPVLLIDVPFELP